MSENMGVFEVDEVMWRRIKRHVREMKKIRKRQNHAKYMRKWRAKRKLKNG